MRAKPRATGAWSQDQGVHSDREGLFHARSIVRRVNALAALSLVVASTGAYAHDGGPHVLAARVISTRTPRAEAASEHFELVAVARGGELTIYLDRLRSNDPVTGATVTVETPAGSVDARRCHRRHLLACRALVGAAGRVTTSFSRSSSGGSAEVLTAHPAGASAVGPEPKVQRRRRRAARSLGGWKDRIVGSDLALIGAAVGGFVLGAPGGGRCWAAASRLRRRLLLAILVALVVPAARAHEGDDHAAAGANDRRRARSRPTAARRHRCSCPSRRSACLPSAPTSRQAPFIAARSNCRAASFPIPMPAASCRPRSAAGFRRRPAAFRGSARASRRATCSPMSRRRCRRSTSPTCASARASSISRSVIVERRIARYEPLAQSGAVARVQLDEARLELQGLKDRRSALDEMRGASRKRWSRRSSASSRKARRRRPDRADQRRRVPDRRSGAAVGRGAELRDACRRPDRDRRDERRAHAAAGHFRAPALPIATSRSRCISGSRATPAGCAPASSSPCCAATEEQKRGHCGSARQRRAQPERPGRRLRAQLGRTVRAAPGARRAARRRARAGRRRARRRASASSMQGAELLDQVR